MDISTVGKKIDDIPVEISLKIIQLFSAGLYSSPNKAFEELVCNSYDAFASKVEIFLPNDLSADGAFIWVLDNGEGLNAIELKNLWKIGESTKRVNTERDKKRLQIGQFGIGKLATYILARKLTYLSKKDNRFILVTMDYERINSEIKELVLDEREVDEDTARQIWGWYSKFHIKGDGDIDLFGTSAESSWTLSILTDLKPKAKEISDGRLKWILRTALPLSPGFNLYLNGVRIESSKFDVPVLKEWIIGKDDKTAETSKNINCIKSKDNHWSIDFENLKGVTGSFLLYKDSLVSGKSAELGRSHGIFLSIRGRLINLDDPLLGMEPFSHGAFNRTRIIINADGLDNNLTSTREAVRDSHPYEQLKDYIKRKFNNEVRGFYFDEENRIARNSTISYRLSQTSYTTSRRPIYNFAKKFFAGEFSNPFLIEKPDISRKDQILAEYEKDIDKGNQVIEQIEWLIFSPGEPLAKLNLETRVLAINSSHPYIANYSDSYQNTLPLESLAVTEVLTEAHLYEIGIDESLINEVMRKRDTTLRELALSDREGIPAVALYVKEAISNPTALEDAVYRALLALGFETIRIGGNGKPDGKADAKLGYNAQGEKMSYSLTFDAKSTAKEKISAGTAHLSALKRHQHDYKADYAVEVAIDYQGADDPESAISKEAKQQSVTVITARDLIRLLLLATPKQLGLDKLRSLFSTCFAPLDVKNWVNELEKLKVDNPPYYQIIDLIYNLQTSDNEPIDLSVLRHELNIRVNKKYSSYEVEEFIKVLRGLIPGSVSIEGKYVSIQNKPDTVKNRIAKLISNEIPPETKKMYDDIFSKND